MLLLFLVFCLFVCFFNQLGINENYYFVVYFINFFIF